MTSDEIREFMTRDWSRVAEAKARRWNAATRTPAGDLRAANELWRYARIARPDWPSRDDRADDLRSHVRVSEGLSAVGVRRR